MLHGEFMVNFLLFVLCNYKIARVDLMLFFQEKLAVVHIYLPLQYLFYFLFLCGCVFTNFSLLGGSSLTFTSMPGDAMYFR